MRPEADEDLEPGTDVWAVCKGRISITPLSASFMQTPFPSRTIPLDVQ